MRFWKRFYKDRGPEGLFTEMRVKIHVDPEFAAHCLLLNTREACAKGEVIPATSDMDVSGRKYRVFTDDELEQWAASRSVRQLRDSVNWAVTMHGAEEHMVVLVTESEGWTDDQVARVARGVTRVGFDDDTYERLFNG